MESWKLAFLLGLGCQVPMAMGQKAFVGAEGFGADAKGIRGSLASASVFHVTNLNDSGTGSFRDAVSAGNRMIVFDVAGIITLNSAVSVDKSNLYIAGQTAPGNISFYGDKVSFSGANNLIARHFAVRKGEEGTREDASGLSRGSNMIFDHMSITWGVDETFSMNPTTGDTIDNITVQKSIIGQGLNRLGHSAGGLMTIGEGNRFSIIKSIFADSVTRNPKVRGENEFINNVVYGYETAGYIMGDTGAVSHANAEGNYFIHGVNTRYDFQTNGGAGGNITINPGDPFTSGSASFFMYGRDNWVDKDRDGVLDGTLITNYPGATVVGTRHAFPTTATMTAQEAVAYVIKNAGMSVIRDAVDQRIADEVASYGTLGSVINRSTDLFPAYNTDAKYLNPRARLVDTDNDGMPDNWEVSKGLNPNFNNVAEWRALNAAGYTRIEEYVNELGADGETILSAGGDWATAATWSGAAPTLADSAIVTGNLGVASGNAFARRIAVGGNLNITGGTLDVFDTAQVDGTLSVTGGTATFGRILLSSAGTNAALTVGAGSTIQTGPIANGGGTALLTFNGGTFKALGAPNVSVPTLVAAAGGTINTNGYNGTLSGGLSGAGTLVKTGAGTLTLAGNNTAFTGGILFNTGTLALASSNADSGTGVVTMAGGTTLNIVTSGTSTPIAVAAGGTVTAAVGGNTYNGTVTGPTNATLAIATTTSGTSSFTLGGNFAAFNGTVDLAASTGNVRIGGVGSAATKYDVGDASATLRSNGGTVNLGSLAGALGTKLTGSVAAGSNVTYVIGGNGTSTTFAGTVGNGSDATTPGITNLTKTGAGTLTLTNAASTYTGTTTVNGGVLSVATLANGGANSGIGASSSAAASLVLDGGTLRYTGGAISIDRTFTLGAAGGTLERNGTGNFALGSVADVVMAGAGNRTLTLGGTSTSFNNFTPGLADPAGGKLNVVKDGVGTWRMAGNAKTYTGDTNVNAGALYLIAGNVLPSGAGKGNVNIAAGATLDIYNSNQAINGLNGAGTVTNSLLVSSTRTLTVGNGDANGNFSGVITQVAGGPVTSLAKVGLGTQILSGANTYAGSTTIAGGTLSVAYSASAASAATPLLAGPGYTDLQGGRLVLTYGAGASPIFTVRNLLADGAASNFATGQIRATTFAADASRGIGYAELGGGQLAVQSTVYGDATLDGVVNVADLGALATNYGASNAVWAQGDFTYDAVVDVADLGRLATYYGAGTGLTAAAAAEQFRLDLAWVAATNPEFGAAMGIVPEPTTLAAVGLGALAFGRRRRRAV